MIRCEGQGGGVWRARRALLAALLLAVLPAASFGQSIGGRIGIEIDGLGEDYRIDLGDGIEEQLEEQPIRSREVSSLALLELRFDAGARANTWLAATEIGRLGPDRRRSHLLLEAGITRGHDRLRIENQWDVQAGTEEPAPGMQDRLVATWDRGALPAGLRSRLRVGAAWSRPWEDSLAALFDYRSFRSEVQLRGDLTDRLELRGEVGIRTKRSLGSRTGSYDAWFAEVEAYGSALTAQDRLDAHVRHEDRVYESDEFGIPSSSTLSSDLRYELRLGRLLRPFVEQRFEIQDYAGSSDVFQDHRLWKGRFGGDWSLDALRRGEGALDPLGNPWRLRTAADLEMFRASQAPEDSLGLSSTYDAYGALLGLSREAGGALWFDLAVEIGRREYRNGGNATNLDIEGLSFRFTTSDFTYVRATLLAEWSPVSWLRAETFLQWDDERHDIESDDFRLWIVNASLTHPF